MRRNEQDCRCCASVASQQRHLGERVAKSRDDLSRKRQREEEQVQRDLLAEERRALEDWDARLRKQQAELDALQRAKPRAASRRAHLNSLVRPRATPPPRTENKQLELAAPKATPQKTDSVLPEGPPKPRYEVTIDSGHYEGWRKKL